MTAREPAADGSGYFLYHSIGIYPQKAQAMSEAFARFADGWGASDDGHWMRALALRQGFIDRWRDVIEAPAGTLTATENVTTSLHSLIGALPESYLRGRRLLVAGDCFPSLHFLLSGIAGRYGFSLDTVPLRQGETWVRDEDMIDRWAEDVGVALLTFVTSTSSHRCDLDALVAHGRRMGSVIGVDITQAAGLLPFSVMRPAVDFTISTTLKWLCGTPGAGILQVAEPLLKDCRPELRGWFSQEDIFSWDLDSFAYAGDIRRFDHGTPGILACAGSLPALEWHAAQDKPAILAHNRTLSAIIIEEAERLGLTLASPKQEHERGGSVMVKLPAGTDMPAVLNKLKARGVFADFRGLTLRLSPGFVTTEDGVERLLGVLHVLARMGDGGPSSGLRTGLALGAESRHCTRS